MSEEKVIANETAPDKAPKPLRAALDRARQQEVERADVIVDLREAELARLELLQDALGEVFEDIPEDNDLLECALIPGSPPRLWIDVLGHVTMGRDKRTYRFLKDTRYGRQVILETTDLDEMAARVTDYVAHRLIERERALDSDASGKTPVRLAARSPERTAGQTNPASRTGYRVIVVAFVLGVLAGAASLLALGLVVTAP